jgi:hypothetical protein
LVGSIVLLLGIITRPLGNTAPRIGVRWLIRVSLVLSAGACFWLGSGALRGCTAAAVFLLGVGCGLPYAGLFNGAAALYPDRAGAAMGWSICSAS